VSAVVQALLEELHSHPWRTGLLVLVVLAWVLFARQLSPTLLRRWWVYVMKRRPGIKTGFIVDPVLIHPYLRRSIGAGYHDWLPDLPGLSIHEINVGAHVGAEKYLIPPNVAYLR
jgi:hypothetical protein